MGPMWDFDNALKAADNWIGIHTNYFYFHQMLKSNSALQEAFNTLWHEKGQYVVNSLIERINNFSESKEGIDYSRSLEFEKEYNIEVDNWQPYIGDLEFMRNYAVTYLANRGIWIEEKINEIETGVEGITASPSSADGISYDMLGRRIKSGTPGLQIINGKKIYVKP